MKTITILTLAAALLGATALADTITLKDGSKREGKIIREGEKQVVLEVAMGRLKAELVLLRKNIKSIEKGASANEKLLAASKKRKARLKKNDAAGWLAYAQWLEKQPGLSKDASAAFEKVMKIKPDNETARRKLGYYRVGKKWLTAEETVAAHRKLSASSKKAPAAKAKNQAPKLDVRVSSPAEDAKAKEAHEKEVRKQLAQIVAEYLGRKRSGEQTCSGRTAGNNMVLTPRRGGYYSYAPYSGGTAYGHFDHGQYYTGYYYPFWYPTGYDTARYSYPYTVVTGRSDLGTTAQIRFVKKGSKVVWRVDR